MDTSEEKFFEQLAKMGTGDEPPFEVKFAKASTPVPAEEPEESDDNREMGFSDGSGGPEGTLMVDVYQTANDIVVESAVAGIDPNNIDVDASTDSLTIRGERKREHRVKDEDYFYQECYWGRFSRTIILPQEVDPESASVSFKNGILTVKLPKLNRKRTKKLKVKVD